VRIAVTGATGMLGAQVVTLLAGDEAHDVVAIGRRQQSPDRLPAGVTAVRADYADLASLRSALLGVDTLVFVSSDGESATVLSHHQNVIRAAADSGVAHIVALSGLDADPSSPFCYAVTYAHTEQLLLESGCAYSIARASIFTEFFAETWLSKARRTGELRLPAADGRISLVSRTDVGRCLAALALAEPTGRHHDLTGPESLDLTEIAGLAEQQWDRQIRYVELSPVEHRVEMAGAGDDPWWMYAFSTMFDSVREQRWTAVSDEILRLTGRPPLSVRDVLAQQPTA
jgi:NAD(P)H dehydrogenase (quinone)